MAEEMKDGGMELLREDHFGQVNPWGQPVVGWNPTSEGFGGIFNPRGWAFLRVALWKMLEGAKVWLYDQPVIVENAGSVVIVQYGDKVGLVRNFRMVGDRLLPDAGAEYVKRLNAEKLWSKLLNTLGRWCWEAPRGLVPPMGQEEGLEEFIKKTAKIEAAEEAGFAVKDVRILGRVNPNSTFFVHSQYVVHAELESIGEAEHENLEILGNVQFFSMSELRRLNDEGSFDDGMTLAALALCGLHLQ